MWIRPHRRSNSEEAGRVVGESGCRFQTNKMRDFQGIDGTEIFSPAPAYLQHGRTHDKGNDERRGIGGSVVACAGRQCRGLGRTLPPVRAGHFPVLPSALPTREDAEDATTESIHESAAKAGTYDSSRPFSSWLYKVASNHCWDLLRRRRIRQDLETEDAENTAAGTSASRANWNGCK